MQKSPTSREIQSTMRDHLTPIRMATIKKKKKKNRKYKCWQRHGETNWKPCFASRIVKRYNDFTKQYGVPQKKKKEISHNSAILLLDIYTSKRTESSVSKSCLHTHALNTIHNSQEVEATQTFNSG